MTLPGTADLEIYHGDSWSQTFRFLDEGVPLDLTGATVKAAAVARYGENQGESTVLTVTIETAPGTISLSVAAGGIDVGEYSYDVQVQNSSGTKTWLRGAITVVPDVTT